MIAPIKKFIIDSLLPPVCIVCQTPIDNNEKVCGQCLSSIALNKYALCPVCFARTPSAVNNPLCHPSVKFTLLPAANYSNPAVQALIKKFKYSGWQSLAEYLVHLLEVPLNALLFDINTNNHKLVSFPSNWMLVPIPLYPARQIKRGFNQAEILAEQLSKKYNLTVLRDNLIRVKNTRPQSELADWRQREQNIAGAFHIQKPNQIKNKNIILIDDIYTSGATLNEAVKILKLAGVKKIVALTIAKAD